jgi:hypothetical protein
VSWKGGGTNIFVHLKTDEGAEGLGYVLDPDAVKRYRVDRFVSLT